MNSISDVLQLLVVLAAVAWIVWKMWQSGVRQAKAFDADERRERGLCPQCGYDVQAGGERCPECGADLREAPPAEPSGPRPTLDPQRLAHDWPQTAIEPVAPHPGAELVPLHSTPWEKEAGLLQEQLLARGVWCRLEVRQEYAMAGAVSVRIPGFLVMVPPEELERAEAVLGRFRLGGGGPQVGPTMEHGEVHDPPQHG